jgi:hypothetical protein
MSNLEPSGGFRGEELTVVARLPNTRSGSIGSLRTFTCRGGFDEHLDVPAEVVFYGPECAEREFGGD